MYKSPALREYNRRAVVLSLIYAATLLAAVYAFKHHLLTGPLRYAVAVLPALPLVAIFVVWGRYLGEESDEYIRMLTIRQTLIATTFMLSVVTVWGFLESFDLVGHAPMYWAAVLWFGGLGLGGCINIVAVRRGRA